MGWTWDAAPTAPATSSCPLNCILKQAMLPSQTATGKVSGSVISSGPGCPSVLPGYVLASSDPSNDTVLPLPSAARCCQACGLDSSCAGFVYNWTGSCTLQRGFSGGSLISGATSSIVVAAARRRMLQAAAPQCPTAAMVPSVGGLATLLGTAGLTWQNLCCYNNLDDCTQPPAGATLLVPCRGAAPASCRASDAVTTGMMLCTHVQTYHRILAAEKHDTEFV